MQPVYLQMTLFPPNRRTRNHYSLAFQTPLTDIYVQFLPPGYNRLELLTDSLISAFECAEDSVTKFTSLVRAKDELP